MAYRQLCAVTFAVLGLIAAGCGGGAATATKGGTGDGHPPNNATDSVSDSASDSASNGDKAPRSSDSPPASVDAPAGSGAGGRLGTLCRQFCDELSSFADRCSDDQIDVASCGGADACQVPPGYIPCANEIADLLSCAVDNLKRLCVDGSGAGDGDAVPQQQSVQPCTDIAHDFEACAMANGLDDDDDDSGGMMTDDGNMPRGCYKAGGCVMCQDECATCVCNAGTDAGTQCLEACTP